MTSKKTNYQPVPTDELDGEDDVRGRICISPETTSSDIDNDDTEDPSSSMTSEKQLLLPSEKVLEKALAKRKAQLVKITIISTVCMLEVIAVPLFFGEIDVFWDALPTLTKQAAKYSLLGTYIVSSLLAPMLIPLFGIKIIFVIACFLSCFFVSANFLPLEYSVIPACVICGIFLGPFFTAQGVFLTNCAFRYCATLTTCDPDAIINLLNGFFYSIFFIGPMILDASKILLLQPKYIPVQDIADSNINDSSIVCGANVCPATRTKAHHELYVKASPDDFNFSYHRIQALLGVYLLCAVTAFITCAILFKSNHPLLLRLRATRCCSPSPQYRTSEFKKVTGPALISVREHLEDSFSRWKDTFLSFTDANMALIIPLFLYLGLQQSLVYNVFSKDIVECRLDRRHVYLMRILIASCSVISSFPVALLARYLGRFRLAVPTACIQISLVLTMSLWQPGLDEWGILFVIAALWGCTDVAWHVMISAMVGRLFRGNKEVAFSQFRTWQMFGILFMAVLRECLCTNTILYVFMAMLVLSMATFTAFEIRIRLQLKEQLSRNGSALTDVTVNLDQQGASWMPTLDPLARRQRAVLSGKIHAPVSAESWD